MASSLCDGPHLPVGGGGGVKLGAEELFINIAITD